MHLPKHVLEELLALRRDENAFAIDRRQRPRIDLNATAYVNILEEPNGLRVHLCNVSADGATVNSSRCFSTGERFILSLPRKDRSANGSSSPLLLLCEVRHCDLLADGIYRCGVQFIECSTA